MKPVIDHRSSDTNSLNSCEIKLTFLVRRKLNCLIMLMAIAAVYIPAITAECALLFNDARDWKL